MKEIQDVIKELENRIFSSSLILELENRIKKRTVQTRYKRKKRKKELDEEKQK